jgi:hypothetical protein
MSDTLKQFFTIILVTILICSCTSKTSKKDETASTQQPVSDTASSATTSTFVWTTELCENKGSYDSLKYSREQLQNTYDLWFRFSGIALETDGTANKPEEISKLDANKLASEYQKQKKYFSQMVIVNVPYWQKLKEQRIQELEDEYELKKITIESYSNPAVLNTNRFSKSCPDFVKALTSKDTAELMAFWKSFAEKQSLKNGSPESYMARFYENFNADNRLVYAKIDLITYGWWNCVNQTLPHRSRDEEVEAEFDKLFSNIKRECDEP